ncbi:tetratricopeptide repeat protein [Gimesia sp.]|uniref:tetratricopeptide repeat protein n=1 Tax=Gimesia sp. TaxID=2024833 RepID=UPI003A922ED9
MIRRSPQPDGSLTVIANRRSAWWLRVCLLLVLFCSPAISSADDPTGSYFEGLRQRHLFGIAEGYCLNRLEQPRITDNERARYTLELIRTLAAHAMATQGQEQEELWKRAEETLTEFSRKYSDWSDTTVFEAERARIAAFKAEILYWQVKADPQNQSLRQTAITQLSQAVSVLNQADTRLSQLLKKSGAFKKFTVLKTATIRDTLLDFQLLIALTGMKLGDLYEVNSPQQKAALDAAEKWLEPLSRRATTLQLTWLSKLALIQCERISGDSAGAARGIQALLKEKPPAYLNEPLFVESMRISLQEGKAQQVASQIIQYRQEHGSVSSELGYLEITALIQLRKIALEKKQEALAEEIWQQVETRSRILRQIQPGYWSQRAWMLVDQQHQVDQYGSQLSQSLKQAQLLYSQGKIEQAIEAYTKTAEQATAEGKGDLAFELAFTSASLQMQAKQYKEAAEQFQSLSRKYSTAPRAADAGLLAAWCLGQLYTQSRTKSRRLAYTAALEEVQKQFPDSKSDYEAGWMLARLEEARLQYSKALVLYAEVPADHPRAADAHLGIARCYEQILQRLTSLSKPTSAWRQEAIDVLEKYLVNFPAESDPLILQSQADIALRLTRIYLNDSPPGYTKANRLLELIISTASRSITELKRNNEHAAASVAQTAKVIERWNEIANQARRLEIITLAGQGNPTAARALVENLENAGTNELLAVLNGVSQINLDLSAKTRYELGLLQLKSAEKLISRRDELNPRQRQQLDLCLAEAYLATNQHIRALEYYQELLKQAPRNTALIKQVAQLLEHCGTKACLREAAQKWRQLESAEKPGSIPWLDARLHIVETTFDSGDEAEARKLLGVTILLYPDLGNDELKQRFQELQQRIQK